LQAIRIRPGRPSQLTELSDLLRYDDAFNRAADSLKELPPEIDESELSQQLREVFERSENAGEEDRPEIAFEISTQALWRAILDTETESSPHIELNGAAMSPSDSDSELILPYEADVDPLGTFASTDEVEVLLIDPDGTEKNIGEVSLKKSALERGSAYKSSFGCL
jgi:hypothetical protein